MQTWSGQNSGGAASPSRKFITTVLLAFSLAGLIIGLTVGGLTSSKPGGAAMTTTPIKKATRPVTQVTQTTSPTPITENIVLDPPTITTFVFAEVANGTTSYTISAQPTDKNSHKPINAADITCRLWLTQNLNETNSALKANNYALLKNVNGFTQPFGQEVANGLVFTAPSAQVQTCAVNGRTNLDLHPRPNSAARLLLYLHSG